MRFELTDEQKAVQQMARDFAEKEIAPIAAEIDRNHRFPAEIVAKLGELGLMGVFVPAEDGGAGMDVVSYIVALEEISKACASTGVIMSVNNSLYSDPVMRNGTPAQKERFLKPYASGKKLGCFALSEPGTGSDAAAQTTVAVKDGAGWVLNGVKNWITNGKEADAAIIFAMTDKAKGNKGISAFLVEKGTPGFSVGKVEEKLGICGSSTTQLVLEDVRLTAENLLGKENEGFKVAMQTLDGGRIGIAAQANGIAKAAIEAAVKYGVERKAFNTRVVDFQGIQWYIADMAMRLEAAQLLTLRAAYLKDSHGKYSKEAAMAKCFASDAANWIATTALQIYGGYGYVKEYPAERYFRDARITQIYEGTNEIQRLVVAANVIKEIVG
jgi:alkylation response protein AidB-like acyl-CoA dehydrogenase